MVKTELLGLVSHIVNADTKEKFSTKFRMLLK